MTTIKEVVVPDIGSAAEVGVIEVNVKPGDTVAENDTLITLESDKASMDIPSPFAGTVKDVAVKVGSKVNTGSLILRLEMADEKGAAPAKTATQKTESTPQKTETAASNVESVVVPDIGNIAEVGVIEVNVKVGDTVAENDTLVTLESDKASMDIPSPFAGTVKEVAVKVGSKVKQGSILVQLATAGSAKPEKAAQPQKTEKTEKTEKPAAEQPKPTAPAPKPLEAATAAPATTGFIYAGPGVRRVAREFGVDLTRVRGTGRKGRIVTEDVQAYVKAELAKTQSGAPGATTGSGLPTMPVVDFSQFGETETVALSRIKKLTAINLHRNWVLIPHVTQFDEVDITEMEAFRKNSQAVAEKTGVKLTPLVFLLKAVVAALKAYPRFNASLAPNGESLILKKYFHIGVAVDTPDGLVVPVLRDVNRKSFLELAAELRDISAKARAQKLTSQDMQGSCFTISSLGGIGGTAFTPIVNAPDVAILGVSKSAMKPVYQDGQFVPRLMLPLSLSYDHRVIDGAEAARFITMLGRCLTDIRELLL